MIIDNVNVINIFYYNAFKFLENIARNTRALFLYERRSSLRGEQS